MFGSSSFPYTLSWLSLYTPDTVGFIVGGVMIAIFIMVIILWPYMYGYSQLLSEERLVKQKKSILWDLVLMKDIQSELDKEIEEMMLSSLMKKE